MYQPQLKSAPVQYAVRSVQCSVQCAVRMIARDAPSAVISRGQFTAKAHFFFHDRVAEYDNKDDDDDSEEFYDIVEVRGRL